MSKDYPPRCRCGCNQIVKLYAPHHCFCGCGRVLTVARRYAPGCYTVDDARADGARGGRAGTGDAKRRWKVTA